MSASSSVAAALCCEAFRFTQYRKTAAMFRAANSKKGVVREEWVENSTSDFAERLKIAEAAGLNVNASKLKPNVSTLLNAPPVKQRSLTEQRFHTTSTGELAAQRKDREESVSKQQKAEREAKVKNETEESIAQHRDEFDKSTAEHWDRVKTFKAARAGRYKQYFAMWGWGFFTWYLVIYAATFLGIYFVVKWKMVDYRTAFEYVYCLTFGAIDRPKFFDYLDSGSPMMLDLSFTMMLNEVLDFWRLPFAAMTFWTVRFWWMKNPGKQMFRDTMPEKAIEFNLKKRTPERRSLMKTGGGTASSAPVAPKPEMPDVLKSTAKKL